MDLIDAYYAVAADIKANGQEMLRQAERLAQIADRMCELKMKENSPPVSANPQSSTGE